VVSGSDENKQEGFSLTDRIYINDGNGYFKRDNSLIPELEYSGSVAKAADFDDDGDLDLFLGGRMIPGKYPESPDSYILVNKDGKLKDETASIAPELKALGMVTDATWSDYDLDGDPDLIIVGEWMPVTIFKNDGGILKKIENSENGLEFSSGWWWRIESMDFDSDGDPDYVLGNLGHNYKFNPSEDEPLEVYINDFNENGKNDFVMGYHQEGKIFPTVDRNRTLLLNRYLKNTIPSNDLYALMGLEDIYGQEKLRFSKKMKVHTHSSGILENKGNGTFEFKAFDQLAQISVTNSIVVNDFNQDGFSDLVLGGNFHLIEAETIRLDAGFGLLMLNDKKGNFKSIPYHKSGLFLDGDVRDLKMLKTAGDPIIICSRNNDYIQLIEYAEMPDAEL
jgi:hypothetical protein